MKKQMMETDGVEEDFEEELKDGEPNPLVTMALVLGIVILLLVLGAICLLFIPKNANREKLENTAKQDILAGESLEDTEETEEQMSGDAIPDLDESIQLEVDFGTDAPETDDSGIEETIEPEETPEDTGEQEPVAGTEMMRFTEVSDMVTAKDVTNLRSAPSTLEEDNIVGQLLNGESINRTGVNENTGWSRLEYNGQTVYAVTRYLTTDLSYQTPVETSDPNRITTQDGRVIIFVDCDDYVNPKQYVNLRTEPSTSQGDNTTRCQINSGTIVHRTGYSADSGWSRVEYEGEILYVVSSMVYEVAAPQ